MDHISEIMEDPQSPKQKSPTGEGATVSIKSAQYRRVGPPGYEHCDGSGVYHAETAAMVFDALLSPANSLPRFPVYLTGDVGRGKTGLAAVLYRIAKRPIWRRADSFLLDLSMGRGDDTYRNEIRKASEASLLVLDDLGVRKPSEGMFHLLFDVLELRKSKPTGITSNKTLDELCEVYTDGRIYSRLAAGTVMTLIGSDRRISDEGLIVYQI
jgi:DNA replication protein DnaC